MRRSDLPDIGQVLAPILARVSAEHRPLLVALAERLAADRYRGWAAAASDPQRRERLLACAEREEDIARRVDALYPDAGGIQREIAARNPDLQDVNRALFADRPLNDQYTIQARGERLGAATWRSLAKQVPQARDTFLACAELEEASAEVLESLLTEST